MGNIDLSLCLGWLFFKKEIHSQTKKKKKECLLKICLEFLLGDMIIHKKKMAGRRKIKKCYYSTSKMEFLNS